MKPSLLSNRHQNSSRKIRRMIPPIRSNGRTVSFCKSSGSLRGFSSPATLIENRPLSRRKLNAAWTYVSSTRSYSSDVSSTPENVFPICVKEVHSYLFTGWRAFSEQVLKILLDKFRDFGYVKLREFEHGVAEELPSSWPHRKIKAEDRLPSAAVAQYSRRE